MDINKYDLATRKQLDDLNAMRSLRIRGNNGKCNGGLAVVEKYGTGYMADIGRRGGLYTGPNKGRPRSLTIDHIVGHSIISTGESPKNKNIKEGSPALKSRDSMLELWKMKQGMAGLPCPASKVN